MKAMTTISALRTKLSSTNEVLRVTRSRERSLALDIKEERAWVSCLTAQINEQDELKVSRRTDSDDFDCW